MPRASKIRSKTSFEKTCRFSLDSAANLAPTWTQLGPMLAPKIDQKAILEAWVPPMAPLGPLKGRSCCQLGPNLSPTWLHVGPNLAPCWPQLGSNSRDMLGEKNCMKRPPVRALKLPYPSKCTVFQGEAIGDDRKSPNPLFWVETASFRVEIRGPAAGGAALK